MFAPRFRPNFFRIAAGKAHTQRVFDLYLKHHRDELLGFGYHQYVQQGRGVLILSCGYRDLFFRQGFKPQQQYLNLSELSQKKLSGERKTSTLLANYDPETELIVYLEVQKSELYALSRLSKKGLTLSLLHRQYLNRMLNHSPRLGIAPS